VEADKIPGFQKFYLKVSLLLEKKYIVGLFGFMALATVY